MYVYIHTHSHICMYVYVCLCVYTETHERKKSSNYSLTTVLFFSPSASLTQPTKMWMCCCFCQTKPITLLSKSAFNFVDTSLKPLDLYLRQHFHYSYDEEADKVNQYQRLNLEGLEKIEIGKML